MKQFSIPDQPEYQKALNAVEQHRENLGKF